MKKKLVIALAALLLIAIVCLLLATVPFYPAFQKTVASMEKLRSALRAESIRYPAMADGEYSDCSYRLELEGRTVFAKPVGYLINGTEVCTDTVIHYCFRGSTKPQSQAQGTEQISYHDVPIYIAHCGDLSDLSKPYQTVLRFSIAGCAYELNASISDNPDRRLSSEERAALAEHMRDVLTTLCQRMIDSDFAS